MEISNKTLAWLVVAAIAVSIFGTTLSVWNLSGRGVTGNDISNTTGEARVDVSQAIILRFSTGYNMTNFGSGQIDTATPGVHACVLATNSTTPGLVYSGCTGFNISAATALQLENVGTSNLYVTLNFSKNDTDFLPTNTGTGNWSRWFRYTVWNGSATAGCKTGTTNTSWGTWVDVGVPNTVVGICGNLTWVNTGKLLIGLNISINENVTTSSSKTVLITAQGTNIA